MSDMYVISEEQIKRYRLDSYIVPDDIKKLASEEIRSRPLSEELKKERERVLDKFEREIRSIPQTHFASVMYIIESLRGEP